MDREITFYPEESSEIQKFKEGLDEEEIIGEIDPTNLKELISSEEAVEWRLARIRAINDKIHWFETKAAMMIDRIKAWLDRKVQTLETRANFLKAPLETYLRNRYERDRIKSVSVPSGRIQLRIPPDKFEVVDLDKAMEWAEKTDPLIYIRTKKDLNKNVIISHIKKTGELVPGIETQKAEKLNFTIILKEEKSE